jgi:hypothetical protein
MSHLPVQTKLETVSSDLHCYVQKQVQLLSLLSLKLELGAECCHLAGEVLDPAEVRCSFHGNLITEPLLSSGWFLDRD